MRNSRIIVVALGVVMLCEPAFAGDLRQFDLMCKGKTRTIIGPKTPEEWSWHLSVDLNENRWCGYAYGCADVYKIANARVEVVELAHRQTYYDSLIISFAPQTGRMAWSYDYNAAMTYLSEGTCKVGPFTPFTASSHMSDDTGPQFQPPPGSSNSQ